MANIIFVTNMEPHYVGMRDALNTMENKEISDAVEVIQINDSEQWNGYWQQKLQYADFFFCTWMGTGLSCDYLKKASAFLQQKKLRHLFDIIDPGDDKMDYGLQEEQKSLLKQYLACGGLKNYQNLCLYLVDAFTQYQTAYNLPQHLPWCGIYHPEFKHEFVELDAYLAKHYDSSKPTVGFIFSREDWLWQRLAYQNEIIRAVEAQNCNVIAVFSTTMPNVKTGAVSLTTAFERFFYKNGRPCIDVLINPFVFSLTVTGFLKLQDLQQLGVPVLQVVNTYMPSKWWQQSMVGLTPNEVSYAVCMPEFDGALHSVPVSTNEEREDGTHYRMPLADRIDMLARKARKLASLRYKKPCDKKIAIVFHNYPPTNSNIGSAASLDSIESVRLLLEEMQKQGYRLDNIPTDSQAFVNDITAHATNDRRFISEALLEKADGKLEKLDYASFYEQLPKKTQEQLLRDWGEAPGEVFRYGDALIVPGMMNGNIFITMQPPRGFGEDPDKIYHSPDCAPTHHYLGFYHWLRDIWGADAMMHIGTHGSLEWLPGKGVAMGDECYPDICTGDLPNVYPYWVVDTGEGIQAKRRSAACLISYLSAPLSISGVYDELAELEKALEEYVHFKADKDADLSEPMAQIREKAAAADLTDEVREEEAADFDDYVGHLHTYLTDLKNMQMTTGLHIMGNPPQGEKLTEYLYALVRLENPDMPSLPKTLAQAYGYDYYELIDNSSKLLPDGILSYGMLLDKINGQCLEIIRLLQNDGFVVHEDKLRALECVKCWDETVQQDIIKIAGFICEKLYPSLAHTTWERSNCIRALQSEYIEPSAGGAPTSGGAEILPTGRNFYGVDPQLLPTPVAWKIGSQMAEDVINKFVAEEGRYPESVGILLWATYNMRSNGQCMAEFMRLMGVRPVWQKGTLKVTGIEIIPLDELKRPRVDVTGRISSLFRDTLPGAVCWLDKAVQQVAALDESFEDNFVRKHVVEESQRLESEGVDKEQAWRQASYRIFGDPPGAHGAGVSALLASRNWDDLGDIADVYVRWGAHVYGEGEKGQYRPQLFTERMAKLEVTVSNIDNRESNLLNSDDYNAYRGGMIAAVRNFSGKMPKNYCSDSSDRQHVVIRTLAEEVKRLFRGEAINPKYIRGMKEFGYKGAGDLATYVDNCFQWDATSAVMEDWMYEKFAEKYALDKDMQKWFAEVNPWALRRLTEVLLEAEQRQLWNAKPQTKQSLQELLLNIEGEIEERGDA